MQGFNDLDQKFGGSIYLEVHLKIEQTHQRLGV